MSDRKPFQGVWNVVRFNRHFYVYAALACVFLMVVALFIPAPFHRLAYVGLAAILLPLLVSLAVTYYVYDRSGLYQLPWLDEYQAPGKVLNINAGFDETSALLADKFPAATLSVCDFYDAKQHTELSIKRAREAYPPYPGTHRVRTHALPFPNTTFDLVCATFAAHEIRHVQERNQFFVELVRITKPGGRIVVTEHLRDLPNFMAYTPLILVSMAQAISLCSATSYAL